MGFAFFTAAYIMAAGEIIKVFLQTKRVARDPEQETETTATATVKVIRPRRSHVDLTETDLRK